MFAVSLDAGCRCLRGGPGYGLMLAIPDPVATSAPVRSFNEHGFLVVPDAIDSADLAQVMHCCDVILQKKETMAFDCAGSIAQVCEDREFRIVQSSPSSHFSEPASRSYRARVTAFASALMRRPVEFWYDRLLGKLPGRSAAAPARDWKCR